MFPVQVLGRDQTHVLKIPRAQSLIGQQLASQWKAITVDTHQRIQIHTWSRTTPARPLFARSSRALWPIASAPLVIARTVVCIWRTIRCPTVTRITLGRPKTRRPKTRWAKTRWTSTGAARSTWTSALSVMGKLRSCRAAGYETCRLYPGTCCSRWHGSSSRRC